MLRQEHMSSIILKSMEQLIKRIQRPTSKILLGTLEQIREESLLKQNITK